MPTMSLTNEFVVEPVGMPFLFLRRMTIYVEDVVPYHFGRQERKSDPSTLILTDGIASNDVVSSRNDGSRQTEVSKNFPKILFYTTI